MRRVNVFIMFLYCFAGIIVQGKAQENFCKYFSEQKNGDTILIKALYKGGERFFGKNTALNYLERKGLLEASDILGTVILQPLGCKMTYTFFHAEKDPRGLAALSLGHFGELLFTCVVFRDSKIPGYNNKPFVVITSIRFTPESKNQYFLEKETDSCNLFSQIERARDTIKINAVYKGMTRYIGSYEGLYLDKRGILKDFDFKSTVSFQPEGCNATYHLYEMDKTDEGELILNGEADQGFVLTIVVFRDPKIPVYLGKPFPIITKIERAD